MPFKELKLKYEKEYSFPVLPADLPPSSGRDTPFFSNMCLGTRGFGKTHTTLQLLDNIDQQTNGFYNCYMVVSPTRKGDLKQKVFFEELERKGRMVYYFDEFDVASLNAVREIVEENLRLWEEYWEIRKIIKKYQQGGERVLADFELMKLLPYIDEDELDNGKGRLNVEDILNSFPDYIQRDYPPTTVLYVDDSYGSRLLTKTQGYNPLTYLLIRHRHLKMSICLLVQSISSIPRAVRSNCILWTVFPVKAEKELKVLYEENANLFGRGKDGYEQFLKVMGEVEAVPYGFLYIDTSSTKDPDVRIGFNHRITLSK